MSVGRSIEESLLKAIRSLEVGAYHLHLDKFDDTSTEDLKDYIRIGTDDRIYAIAELLRRDTEAGLISDITGIDIFFICRFRNIIKQERELTAHHQDMQVLADAKRMGFSDKAVGRLWGMSAHEVFDLRKQHGIMPVYKMIDTCASEFKSYVPYFYSTYEQENESQITDGTCRHDDKEARI